MPHPIRVAELVEHAAALFGVPPAQIYSPSRKREYFQPRAAVSLAAKVSGRSYRRIGDYLGGRDHNTIQNACDRAEYWWRQDEGFRAKCAALIELAEQHRKSQTERD